MTDAETEADRLTELRHYTCWDADIDALAVRAAAAGCLITASDAASSECFGAMEGSSLSSATIVVTPLTDRPGWLPQPEGTFIAALGRHILRRLGQSADG